MQKTTIEFLKNLKKNNNKEWFDKNRPQYELANEDFLILVSNLLKKLAALDTHYENQKAKDCVFRINRDVRFSKDKSPYKTNMGAAFQIGGKKGGHAAFYMHIEPGNSFVGGGLWVPEADKLKKVRQEIDYHFDDFKKIIQKKDFVNTFGTLSEEDKLKNPPKGYEADNKAVEYLKLKSFVTGQKLQDADLHSNDLEKNIYNAFKTLSPFIAFLNKAIEE